MIWIPKTANLSPLHAELRDGLYECRRLDGAPELFEHFYRPLVPQPIADDFVAECRRWYASGHSPPASGARTAAYKALVAELGAETVKRWQEFVREELDRLEAEVKGGEDGSEMV